MLALFLRATRAGGAVTPPVALAPAAAVGPGRVYLDWPPAPGATSYNVKRSQSAGGPHGLLANVATTYDADTTPTGGVRYCYAVTAVSNAGAGSVTAAVMAVTNGAEIDVAVNGPGSTVNFLDGFWRSTQTWAVAMADNLTGTFALGAISTDTGGRPAADYVTFSLAQTSGQVSLAWTPVTGYEFFAAQITSRAARGPQSDPDGDGHPNLLEYATGGSPTNADRLADMAAVQSNGLLWLHFTRNTNSIDATLLVEDADGLLPATWVGVATNVAGSWGGATNVLESGTGTPMAVRIDDLGGTNRFLHLHVVKP